MLCDFTEINNNNLICKRCGRKLGINQGMKFPSAKCRIPENYNVYSGYLGKTKIKGLGDILSDIIKKMGYDYQPIGKVRARLTFLNKRSLEWCEKNKIVILRWLQEECKNRSIPIRNKIMQAIVRLAIKKVKYQSIS